MYAIGNSKYIFQSLCSMHYVRFDLMYAILSGFTVNGKEKREEEILLHFTVKST